MLKEVVTIKKILFGITSLTLGGAERVLVDISNKLSEKYDITIFSIYDNGELKNDLNKNVKFKALYNCRYDELTKLQKMWIPIKILLFSKIIYNKKIKQNYDTEIAFLEGPITRLFSTKNKDVHKIAWIHNDIEKVFGNDLKSKIKKYIDKKIYKKYNDLVFVSQDNMEKFQNIYNDLNTENMHVIYNYIDKDLVIKKSNYNIKAEFDYNSINFLTVCRLVKQKAIDRFIRVHSKLMVLEEAKILNKPIIITNTAARECIENYPKALILENSEDEIYDGLYKLLNDNDDKIFNNTQTSTEYDNTEKLQKIIELVGD